MNEQNLTRKLFTALTNVPATGENHNLYVWTKCFLFRENNYDELSSDIATEDYKQAVEQLVGLKGFDYTTPVKIADTITMHNLLRSLHFNINIITDYTDGTIQVDALDIPTIPCHSFRRYPASLFFDFCG